MTPLILGFVLLVRAAMGPFLPGTGVCSTVSWNRGNPLDKALIEAQCPQLCYVQGDDS